MKKFETKREREEKIRKRSVIIGIIIVIIMTLSVVGFALLSRQETRGKKGIYQFKIGNRILETSFSPEINVHCDCSNLYFGRMKNKVVYLVYNDSNIEIAIYELIKNIKNDILRVQPACLENKSCNNPELPIKSCYDGLVIVFNKTKNSGIKDNNCIYFNYNSTENLLKVIDKFIFTIYDIK